MFIFFLDHTIRISHESKETSSRTSVIAHYIHNTFSLVREQAAQGAAMGEYLYESLAKNYLMHLMEKKVRRANKEQYMATRSLIHDTWDNGT